MCRTKGTIFEKYCKIIRREIEYLQNECRIRNESMKYVQYGDFWQRTRKICWLILLCFKTVTGFAKLWV